MQETIKVAPTSIYPESDGKPMAETEYHRDIMIDFIQMLKHHFRNIDDAYVSGNLMMYYEEGNFRKSVAPDVFVVFGVSKKQRRTYRTWEEGQTPDFILEVASKSTYAQDLTYKKDLYASVLGVREYYIYDPYREVDRYFLGYRRVEGVYQEIGFVEDRLPSIVLGLELGEREGVLGLYDPRRSVWLTPLEERVEQAVVAQQQEAEARQQAEARAIQEAEARQQAEAELKEALAALERLQQKTED